MKCMSIELAKLEFQKVIQSIQNDLDEAKESFSDCENEIDKSFQQGRIFAHNYDLFVIERILKDAENE